MLTGLIPSLGGNLASSAASAAYIGVTYRSWWGSALEAHGNAYVGRFYSSALLRLRADFPTSFPFYVAGNLTYNHKDYFKNTIYFFEDSKPSYVIQNDNHVGLELCIPATMNGKISNGYQWGYTKDKYYETNTFTKQDTADETSFNFFTANISFEINSLNRKQYADKGQSLFLELKFIDGEEKTTPGSTSETPGVEIKADHNWVRLKLLYDSYPLKFKPVTIGFYAELLLSNQPAFQNYTATMLHTPSFDPIPEMKTLYLPLYRASNYAAIGLKGIFNIYKQLDVRIETYLFQPYEEFEQADDGTVVKKKELSHRSVVASGVVLYRFPFGPISLSVNYYDRAEDEFSIMFNLGYILFNKGALD